MIAKSASSRLFNPARGPRAIVEGVRGLLLRAHTRGTQRARPRFQTRIGWTTDYAHSTQDVELSSIWQVTKPTPRHLTWHTDSSLKDMPYSIPAIAAISPCYPNNRHPLAALPLWLASTCCLTLAIRLSQHSETTSSYDIMKDAPRHTGRAAACDHMRSDQQHLDDDG
jgi:hypothetical protein